MTADGNPKTSSAGSKEPKRSIQKRETGNPVAAGNKKSSGKMSPTGEARVSDRAVREGVPAPEPASSESEPQTPLDRAVSLAGDLLHEFEPEIESIQLLPSDGGRFEVTVNGKLIFSKKQLGRHVEPGEVAGLVRKLIQ